MDIVVPRYPREVLYLCKVGGQTLEKTKQTCFIRVEKGRATISAFEKYPSWNAAGIKFLLQNFPFGEFFTSREDWLPRIQPLTEVAQASSGHTYALKFSQSRHI